MNGKPFLSKHGNMLGSKRSCCRDELVFGGIGADTAAAAADETKKQIGRISSLDAGMIVLARKSTHSGKTTQQTVWKEKTSKNVWWYNIYIHIYTYIPQESFPIDEVIKLLFSVIEHDSIGKQSKSDWQRILSMWTILSLTFDCQSCLTKCLTKVRIKCWQLIWLISMQ